MNRDSPISFLVSKARQKHKAARYNWVLHWVTNKSYEATSATILVILTMETHKKSHPLMTIANTQVILLWEGRLIFTYSLWSFCPIWWFLLPFTQWCTEHDGSLWRRCLQLNTEEEKKTKEERGRPPVSQMDVPHSQTSF